MLTGSRIRYVGSFSRSDERLRLHSGVAQSVGTLARLDYPQTGQRTERGRLVKRSLLDRILSRCVLGATSYKGTMCWLFLGSHCNKHYPQVKVAGVCRRVHRVLWELVNGRAIRDGYTLDHLCLNTGCIRPEHLEEVTRSVNTVRGNKTRHKRKEMRF